MLIHSYKATPVNPLRIVIADEQPLFIDGFCAAMSKHPHIQIAGIARNGKELLETVAQHLPQVVLTSLELPGINGVEATKHIEQHFHGVKVIVLSPSLNDAGITGALEAGAWGFLTRNQPAEVILKAIEKVVSGEVYYSEDAANRMVALLKRTAINPMKPFDKPHFTTQQLDVLIETGKGFSTKEIAQKLKLELCAVESIKRRLLAKTGCRNTVALAVYAVRHFLVP
jgi:DNA-binding NarL/FixJ family response regulator